MQTLNQAIAAYRRKADGMQSDLAQAQQADAAQLAALAGAIPHILPAQLIVLYQSIGGLHSTQAHGPQLQIDSVQQILASRSANPARAGMGLLDSIQYSAPRSPAWWDGVNAEEVQQLNREYLCFGWFKLSAQGNDMHWLYADYFGRFGILHGKTDRLHELQPVLRQMLAHSPARQLFLPALLQDVLQQMEQALPQAELLRA
ncbi:hypothetical protein V8J88_15995 [Massilia sp. W12]|uniref:hypothetical protein n=1 Tax=Massilia sp. W12 TaxID=3126507 RepID=UPI0030CF64B5